MPQRSPILESLREKKGVVLIRTLNTINGTKYSNFQEAARAAGLSKSGDFISQVLDDAASEMNLTEDRSLEHPAGDSTIWLGCTTILRENTLRVVGDLSSLFPCSNLTRGLAARRLFRAPPCREGTIRLQTSMPSLGFEPRPYGTAVSVVNQYNGWAASPISSCPQLDSK
ncbi:hypothetical protein TNCV_3548481 [Trichonephila clavipes]|nr:hypothetical protein TNCV_3548481 [Trichonephila clavipes]